MLAALVAPSNTGRSRPRLDGSILPLTHPRLLAQLLEWPVDEVKRSSFQRKSFEALSRALGGLNRISPVLQIRCNKMWLLPACLWLMPDLTR